MKTNKKQHTKKALLEALEKSLGVVTQACKIVGVDRGTFYRYYNEDENFKNAVKELEGVSLDFVESKLFKQIETGNVAATIFYLKTKGKHRGYVERQEISGGGDKPLTKVIFDFGTETNRDNTDEETTGDNTGDTQSS